MDFKTLYRLSTLGYRIGLLDIVPYMAYCPKPILSRIRLWGIKQSIKFALEEGTWMFQGESILKGMIRVKDSIPSRKPNGELHSYTYVSTLPNGVYNWKEVDDSLLKVKSCEVMPYHLDPRLSLFESIAL
jgi:hypothetical protein